LFLLVVPSTVSASGQKSKFIERVIVRPPVKPVGRPKNGEVSTPLKLRGWLWFSRLPNRALKRSLVSPSSYNRIWCLGRLKKSGVSG